MGWDGRELKPLDESTAVALREQAPEMIFSEGEEVTLKGVVFTVSLIEPPRIVLKAKKTAATDRAAIAAAQVKERVEQLKEIVASNSTT